MSTVDSWDPTLPELTNRHEQIISNAILRLRDGSLEINDAEQAILRPTMKFPADQWRAFVAELSDEKLVDWIKLLTLVERDLNGFEAGAESPVLALISVLKERKALPTDLFTWIRAHTMNRFLPYGSLANRL